MRILSDFIFSLVLTMALTFAVPMFFLGGTILLFSTLSYVPGAEIFSQTANNLLFEFLTIFGAGDFWHGMFIVGSTSAVAGGLFEIFNFYRYQNLS